MKKYLLLLIVFISAVFYGCEKDISSTSFLFNKEKPEPITLTYEGELKRIQVEGTRISETITDFKNLIQNNSVILNYDFFAPYEAGGYLISLESDTISNYTVTLTGEGNPYNYIRKQDIFNIEESKYYVFFTREGCSGCEKLKPDLAKFNSFLAKYPNGTVPSIYLVDYEAADYEASKGENPSLTGVSSYDELINNVSLSTPTIAIVENGVITEYYSGYSNVSSFLYVEMSNIEKQFIIHNIDSPKEIEFSLDFIPKKYSITDSEGESSIYSIKTGYTSESTGFNEGTMHFQAYTFNKFINGIYTLKIYNDTNSFSITLIITSIFNYIELEDLFNMPEESYYVFFLKDGCPYCNSLKPALQKYTNFHKIYNSEDNYPMYAAHRSHNSTLDIYGTPENFVGVSSLDDLKLGFYPRVVLIQNGVITKLYDTKTDPISKHFNNIMSK